MVRGKHSPVILLLFLIVLMFQKNGALSGENAQNGKVIITVKEGNDWLSYLRFMLFIKISKPPQIAFWLEETDGTFVETLYVTHRTATQDWKAMPFEEKEDIKRPSSLPIWLYKHVRGGIHTIETCSACHDRIRSADKSTGNNPLLDTLTGATPEKGFTMEWIIPSELKPGDHFVCSEINHSFDFNDTFKKDLPENNRYYNGVSGQPSLLLRGMLRIGNEPSQILLRPAGHGHPAGTNGNIYRNLEGITSAFDIIESIEAKYSP